MPTKTARPPTDESLRGHRPGPSGWTEQMAGLRLVDWRPRSMLQVPQTEVRTPRAPCIEAHNHLGRWLTPDGSWEIADVSGALHLMDAHHVELAVNLDGRWGGELEDNLDRYDRSHPDRFVTFGHLDWRVLTEPDGPAQLRDQVRALARSGVGGIKVWKDLGLAVRDGSGNLVMPDDERVQAAMALAGDLGLPIMAHIADPRAFFEPVGATNERYEELIESPAWSYADRRRFPAFDSITNAFERLVLATPGTTYIGAHLGGVAEDLDRVERLLDAAPNYTVDIAGRLAEIGRQPRRFRRLAQAHPDRILFGTDSHPLNSTAWVTTFRFLETDDEAFAYDPEEEVPSQGRWTISGAHLPAEILPAIYAGNARRVLAR